MASATFLVFSVVPFCEGWRPVVYGTPTLTEWPFSVSGVVPFCEGRRPVNDGTPTLTQWPNTKNSGKIGNGYSVRVGVP